MRNSQKLSNQVLLTFLMTVCATRATLLQSLFTPIRSGVNVEGTILMQFAVRSSVKCPVWCSMQDHCDTYTYSGPNCILIHRSDNPDGLKFLASEQSPIFEKETLPKDPNPCDSNPCQHDSTCHREDAPDKVTCICLPDFSGKLCQFNCKVDWCPPPDFTSEIVPIVYRNLDDEEKVTFENRAKVDSGKVDGAAVMVRDNEEWVDLGDLSVACITQPQTCGPEGAAISVWLNLQDCPANSGIISSLRYGTSGFAVYCLRSGSIQYDLRRTTDYYAPIAQYPDKEWYHLIINYLGPSGGVCIYYGNQKEVCQFTASSAGYAPGSGDVVLGRYYTNRDDKKYYASGSVDELMFFNTQLSDLDIEALVKVYTN